SSAGGKAEPLIPLSEGEVTQRWPQMLPGAKGVLFTSAPQQGNLDNADVVVQPLLGGARKILQRGGYFARFVASGHIVYIHGGTLFAAPFDVDRLALTGQPVPLSESVTASTGTGGHSSPCRGPALLRTSRERRQETRPRFCGWIARARPRPCPQC